MKVGIIGCGFIAEVHIQALRAVGQEVFAIVGRDREKTENGEFHMYVRSIGTS